jgi:hypothetical protein
MKDEIRSTTIGIKGVFHELKEMIHNPSIVNSIDIDAEMHGFHF